MVEYAKIESYKNGIFLGIAFSAALLWGDLIKQPILDALNGIIPEAYQFTGITAYLIIIIIGAGIGYLVDKT